MKLYILITEIFIFLTILISANAQESNKNLITQKIPGSDQHFDLKLIEAGEFETESGKKVTLDAFYIGTNEVTYDLFILFKRKEFDSPVSNLSNDYKPDAISRPTPPYEDMTWGMGDEGGFPAVSSTQQAALRFCEWLYLKTGTFYRLPTEAEWTYAALLNSTLDKDGNMEGWFKENSNNKYHKTGEITSKNGISDLFGNVLEWTLDSWEDDFLANNDSETISNPWVEPVAKNYRVLKGGSFHDKANEVTPFTRFKSERKWQQRDPQIPKSKWWLTDGSFVGFRLVSPIIQPSKEEIMTFFVKAIKD